MRLNDPQIELVHDDPFMGYINEDTTAEDTTAALPELPAPASPSAIGPLGDAVSDGAGDEEPPATELNIDDPDEELDVGENSRIEAITSIQKAPISPSARTLTVPELVEQSTTTSTTTNRQPYVIVLLME
uniref:Uncharacterized protein n=1 Tax=Anopheles christyi TaxID=43041 RepID=A0A182KIU1_9DIPT